MIRDIRERIALVRLKRRLARAGSPHATEIPTYTRLDELEILYELARSLPEHAKALEIGSFLGASACFIGAALADRQGRLFCVDTWRNENMPEAADDTFPIFVRNTRALGSVIVPVRKESSALTPDDIAVPLDFLFIDGDHAYLAVREDVARTSRWLAPAGIIAFHDSTAFAGVSRVIGELLSGGRFKLSGHHRNLTWLVPADWATQSP